MSRTTIIIGKTTRKDLKNIGRKGQTYDEIIAKLIASSQSNKAGPILAHRITNKDSSKRPLDESQRS